MRVLSLVTDAYGGSGGIAQASRDVIGALASADKVEHVDVLPRASTREPLELPPRVHQFDARRCKLLYAAVALCLARAKPSVIYCNHVNLAPLAVGIGRLVGSKVMVHLHGIEIWERPSLARRRALEGADLLVCVSRDTRARVLAHIAVRPERAIVLNNTFGKQFLPGNRQAARAKYGVNGNFVILTVGRLSSEERYKGQDRVIRALKRLKPEGPRVVYLIAGEGGDRPRLESLAQELGVAEQVRFLGRVPAAELPELYRAADLFALPSTGEGFGIAFLEAMACGTPALGLRAGGAPDALLDGELGMCVESESFEPALQLAMEALQGDPLELSRRVYSHFGLEVFRARVGRALELAISR